MARSHLFLLITIFALLAMVLAAPVPDALANSNSLDERTPEPEPIKGGASFSPLEALRNRGSRLPQRAALRYYSGNIEAVREVKWA